MNRSLGGARRRAATCLITTAAVVAGLLAAPGGLSGGAAGAADEASRLPGSDIYTFDSRYVVQHGDSMDKLRIDIGDRTIRSAEALAPIRRPRCNAGIWLVDLERSDLTLHSNIIYPLCDSGDVAAVNQWFAGRAADHLVVANSLVVKSSADRPESPVDLDQAMHSVGAPTTAFSYIPLATTTFSLLGVVGAPSGAAQYAFGESSAEHSGVVSTAALQGRLVPDPSPGGKRQYSLAHLDFVTYDISRDGKITINGAVRPEPPHSKDFGGYRVLVVDRRTLGTISDRLYETHAKVQAQIALERDLLSLDKHNPYSVLVFLVTLGDPTPPTSMPRTSDFEPGCTQDEALAFEETCTLTSVKHEQSFTLPKYHIDGVQPDVEVTLQGAHGGAAKANGVLSGGDGGPGARFRVALGLGHSKLFSPGQTVYAEVGGNGEASNKSCFRAAGGWNGGGSGGQDCTAEGYPGGGGGGMTDLRLRPSSDGAESLKSRVFIAAGGGGAGGEATYEAPGGNGGAAGQAGHTGVAYKASATNGGDGGGPANTGTGGTAGHGGTAGSVDTGGVGADPDSHTDIFNDRNTEVSGGGGGGGGGVYGGGGGGRIDHADARGYLGGGGGGGGSSLAPGATVTTSDAEPSVAFSFLSTYGPTMGDVLRRFGATPTLVQQISTRTPHYAMVATPGYSANDSTGRNPFAAVEASEANVSAGTPDDQRPTGRLQGVLGRGTTNMWFAPVASHAVSPEVANGKVTGHDETVQTGFYDILAERATGACLNGSACPAPDAAYPFTGALPNDAPQAEKDKLKAQKAALRAIEVQLCPEPGTSGTQPSDSDDPPCQDDPVDIRTTYAFDIPDTKLAAIKALTMPTDARGYDQKTYDEVKAQIGKEVGDVIEVHKQEVALHNALAQIPNDVGNYRAVLIKNLKEAVPEGEDTTVEDSSFGLKVAAFFLEIVELILDVTAGPEAGEAVKHLAAGLGLLASAMVFSGEAAEFGDSKAGKPHEVKWDEAADDIVTDTVTQLQATVDRQDEMFDLIYGNWGMLAAYATNLAARPAEWNASTFVGGNLLHTRVASAAKLSLYQSTVPLRFDAAELTTGSETSPTLCFAAKPNGNSDCTDFPGYSRYSYSTNPYSGTSGVQSQTIAVAAQPDDKEATPLPKDLVEKMTALGLDEPDLFLHWPFLRQAVVKSSG